MKRLIYIIVFVLLSSYCFATDYYFDYTNGLDTNSGLTEELAFKTFAKFTDTVMLSQNNAGYFKRGESWVMSQDDVGIAISQSNTVVGVYGTGVKPIISFAGAVGDGIRGNNAINVCIRIAPYLTNISVDNFDLHGAQDEYALDAANDPSTYLSVTNCDLTGDGWEEEGVIRLTGSNQTVTDCAIDGGGNSYSKLLEIAGSSTTPSQGTLVKDVRFIDGASFGGALRLVYCEDTLVDNCIFTGVSPGQSNYWQLVIRDINNKTANPWVKVNNCLISSSESPSTDNGVMTGIRSWLNFSGTTLYVTNSTLISNGYGSAFKIQNEHAVLRNNIFVNWYAIFDFDSGTTGTVSNNQYYNYTNLEEDTGVVTDEGSNYTTDPLLVSTSPETADDFAISSASSDAVGGGTTGFAIPLLDYFGITRDLTSPDLGGIKYVSSTIPVLTCQANDTTTSTSYPFTATYILEGARTVSTCTWSIAGGASGSCTATGGNITGTATLTADSANVITISLTDSAAEVGNCNFTVTHTTTPTTGETVGSYDLIGVDIK